MIFFKKVYGKISQMFWKVGISKRIALEHDLSGIIGKDEISFSQKYDLIVWTEKWNILFFKIKHGNTKIFIYLVKIRFLFPANMV